MKLKQVIINILGDSVKFTPEGCTVSFIVEQISQFEDKATIRFVMKDTGIGMSKEYLPKIFDTFSQEDSRKTNKYGSTGLGLAITKNIVEMMNGDITVESEKGVGSVFTVTVTLKRTDKKAGVTEKIRPQDMRILVIDDDSAIIILTAYSWDDVIDEALAAGETVLCQNLCLYPVSWMSSVRRFRKKTLEK